MTGALFVDAGRCIGCRACVEACSECPDHGGRSMIHLDWLDRSMSVETAPTVCMHCADPACAAVCPADAIKIDPQGIVLSAAPERCIGCGNCALACPFGVPKLDEPGALMRKCDLCYDRTSAGRKPMCATVCPSGALHYGTEEEITALRAARPQSRFSFGDEIVITRNAVMLPNRSGLVAAGGGATVGRSAAERHLEEALC
ncbi:MAG: 4Fe-4S dicluster domain-containing protein [Candidatus Binatia bacterium]